MTDHALDRLQNRVQPQHRATALGLINAAGKCNDAALVANVGRDTSLVVIAREYQPVTVMYCRRAQVNPSHLRVKSIIIGV